MELQCKQCGIVFTYFRIKPQQRGRNPVRCDDCRKLPMSQRYPKKTLVTA